MGFYLTEQLTDPAAANSPATGRSHPGAKTLIGAPFWYTILSTKYWDDDTGLGNWGMRYYHPDMGRWLSRDPIGEEGGKALYVFVHNAPVDNYDKLGLVGCKRQRSEAELAGSRCCPACEINELRTKRADWKRRWEAASNGNNPDKLGGTTLGKTVCVQPAVTTGGGTAHTVYGTDISKCVGFCVYQHEQIHVSQCQDVPWLGDNLCRKLMDVPKFDEVTKDALTAQIERPAYAVAWGCALGFIMEAEAAIRKYGSAEAACRCCMQEKADECR